LPSSTSASPASATPRCCGRRRRSSSRACTGKPLRRRLLPQPRRRPGLKGNGWLH
jgi:hypothetical protein